MSSGRQAGLSLLEVVIAVGLLLVAMLGIASTFSIVQVNQAVGKERAAAAMAASSKLDEIATWLDLNDYDDLVTTWDDTGFDIVKDPEEIGARSATSTSTMFLVPAPNSEFAPHTGDRAAAPAAVQDQAGFINVIGDVSGRTGLAEVEVIVVWVSRASGAGNSNEKVVYKVWLADK